jgi:chromosome segregation ATPase
LYSAVLRAKRDRDEELASLRDRVAELERDLTVEREQVESWKRALGQLVEARNFFRDELDCARSAMREAVRDFHCKSVLFSASFLRISGDVETKG